MFKQVKNHRAKPGGKVVLSLVVTYFTELLREHFSCCDLQWLIGRILAVDVSKS